MHFLHSPVTSSLLGPHIPISTLFLNTLSLCSSLNLSDNISYSLLNYLICASCVLCAKFPVFCARKFLCSVPEGSCVLCVKVPVFCARRFLCSVRKFSFIDRIFYIKFADGNFSFYTKQCFDFLPFSCSQ